MLTGPGTYGQNPPWVQVPLYYWDLSWRGRAYIPQALALGVYSLTVF